MASIWAPSSCPTELLQVHSANNFLSTQSDHIFNNEGLTQLVQYLLSEHYLKLLIINIFHTLIIVLSVHHLPVSIFLVLSCYSCKCTLRAMKKNPNIQLLAPTNIWLLSYVNLMLISLMVIQGCWLVNTFPPVSFQGTLKQGLVSAEFDRKESNIGEGTTVCQWLQCWNQINARNLLGTAHGQQRRTGSRMSQSLSCKTDVSNSEILLKSF